MKRVVLLSQLRKRYEKFLHKVAQTGRVWVLVSPSGRSAVIGSLYLAGRAVELAFSSPELAKQVAAALSRWAGWSPREVALDDYLAVLGDFGGQLIAPDPTAAGGGALELTPEQLAAALIAAHGGEPIDLSSVTEQHP